MKKITAFLLAVLSAMIALPLESYTQTVIIKNADTLSVYEDSPTKHSLSAQKLIGANAFNLEKLGVPKEDWPLFNKKDELIYVKGQKYKDMMFGQMLDRLMLTEGQITKLKQRENFLFFVIVILIFATGYFGQSYLDNKKKKSQI